MRKSYRGIGVGLVLAVAASAAALASEQVDLRGYGKVAADLTPARSVFECQSTEKADILLDKLQADLFWDKTLPVTTGEVNLPVGHATIYSLPGYGSALIARSGSRVLILGGADEQTVSTVAATDPLLKGDDVTSKAAKPHPVYLDFFDNRAFKPMLAPMKDPMDSFGRNLAHSTHKTMAIYEPLFEQQCPAPGAANWVNLDFEVQAAQRNGDMVTIAPYAGPVPLWVRNAMPYAMMQPTATTVLGDWGGAGVAGGAFESWSMPLDQRLKYGLGFTRAVVERYRTSEAVGGWYPYAGLPSYEYCLMAGRAMLAWDASPVGQAGYRSYLRDVKGLSLADVGNRYYADANHFSKWDEVTLPDLNEFFGQLGPDCQRLTDGWRWQNRKTADAGPIASDAPGWVPLPVAPSQQGAFVNKSGFNFYEASFDPGAWRTKQGAGANMWLVFGLLGGADSASHVWLNGKPLTLPPNTAWGAFSFAVDVKQLLQPGVNRVQIALQAGNPWVQCCGVLCGPVFLTSHEPKRFPYLGREQNARYADLVNWRAWALSDYHRTMIQMIRKLDPDRPMVLSVGIDGPAELYDFSNQICTDFSLGEEDTGTEGDYRSRHSSSGLAAGFYGTSEFSNGASGIKLERGFSTFMFNADSSHILYPGGSMPDSAYAKEEKATGWFTRHARQIAIFGKYLREQPKVAVLSSGLSARLTPAGTRDFGRGDLQQAHFDNVYVSEIGMNNGLADPYPVLFDIGNQVMEDDTIAAVGKYVANGGAFIAQRNSGIHSGIDADSYPLAKVSGFRPAEAHSGLIKFESNLPLLKGWENRQFQAWGKTLVATVRDGSTQVLARWSDGSIAIGYRKVGQGKVLTLGCQFWADIIDPSKTWKTPEVIANNFYAQLLKDCGVERNANASASDVWARKLVTKNGLQSWLMAFNTSSAVRQVDLWMAVDAKPDQVIDVDTNQSVPFVYEKGGVTLKDTRIAPCSLRAFAVRRATLAGALPTWWYEKTRYWKRTPADLDAERIVLPDVKQANDEAVIPISTWRFKTDPAGMLLKQGQWTSPSFADSDWQSTPGQPWNLFDPALKDYHGVGLYRTKFAVPPAWKGTCVLFNMYSFDYPIAYDTAEFFINGVPVASYRAHTWNQTYNYDVTDHIQPGENVLSVQLTGGADKSGLGGVFWIESRPALNEPLDLNGTWQSVAADWVTHADVTIPGQAEARYLKREIAVPAAYAGKDAYIEWSSRSQWVGCVVVNGRPINFNSWLHPFGPLARVNVAPFIKPGQTNTIELWPYRCLPWLGNSAGNDAITQLDTIRIGYKQ